MEDLRIVTLQDQLEKTEFHERSGVNLALLGGDEHCSHYVGQVEAYMKTRHHSKGSVMYEIFMGTGFLWRCLVEAGSRWTKTKVQAGMIFFVEPGIKHCLVREGFERFVVRLTCPRGHINGEDWIAVDHDFPWIDD